ncbi:hypothetical protein GCM10007338_09940 [Corynebacterium pelargi]|nr:hypothetical protein GCM10007338_09940 [Corynebacterium pelargi]
MAALGAGLALGVSLQAGNVVSFIPVQPAHAQDAQCASGATPEFDVAAEADAQNQLRIVGTGWCNSEGLGGAKIAVKLDEGNINHLDTSLHENTTIWYIIEAQSDGSFDVNMPLPDGTNSGKLGSNPTFGPGEHSIRLLSGSLQEGDVRETRPTPSEKKEGKGRFLLGEYKPNGLPDTVFNYDNDLSSDKKNGVKVSTKGDKIQVQVPSAQPGTWVYLSAYNECGQTNDPYGEQWFQLAEGSTVTAALKPVDALRGNVKITVQDGSRGAGQKLIGWDYLDSSGKRPGCAEPAESDEAEDNQGGDAQSDKQETSKPEGNSGAAEKGSSDHHDDADSNTSSYSGGGTNPSSTIALGEDAEAVSGGFYATDDSFSGGGGDSSGGGFTDSGFDSSDDSQPRPDHDPEPPVKKASELNDDNAGEVDASLDGTILSLHAEPMAAGDWVFLHSYNPDPKALGWVEADVDGNVYIDIAGLKKGSPKITLTSADDELLGWVLIDLGDESNGNRPSVRTASSQTPLMDGRDWALIIGALFAVGVAAGGLMLGRRSRS